MFEAIAPAKLPIPMCIAIPIPRLYCPARLFPSLRGKPFSRIPRLTKERDTPCNNTWESSVTAGDNKERPEIFDTIPRIRDVNYESDETKYEPSHDERKTHFGSVRKEGPNVEHDGYWMLAFDRKVTKRNILATTYGGTVSS
jgi:hypothetical protein